MYKLIILVFAFISLKTCDKNANCNVDTSVVKSNDNAILEKESNAAKEKRWGEYLNKLEEPKLKNEEVESYRLIKYTAMGETSKTYRILKEGSSYKLIYKYFGREGSGGIATKLIENKVKKLSKKDWIEFQTVLFETGFWSLSVNHKRTGFDGTNWILEGINPKGNSCTDRKYHIINRWEPLSTMKISEIGKKIIELNE